MNVKREAPPKITTVHHVNDEDLKRKPEMKYGYKNKVLFSTVETDLRHFGNDRMFDKLIKKGEALEAEVLLRKKNRAIYFQKP